MDVVLQWNCRSVVQNKSELHYLFNHHKPFISAVSETWLVPGSIFRIPGYAILRDEREDGRGGCALFIKNNLSFTQIPINNSSKLLNIVALRHNSISYVSVYIPNRNSAVIPILRSYLSAVPPPLVLLGDFNCHHQLWGAPNNHPFGRLF